MLHRLAGVLVALVLAAGGAAPAAADRYDDANRKLFDLEERVRAIAGEFRDAPAVDSSAADRRVLDAELLYNLKNYSEAATICLDVIEKYPNSRAYDDALVLLGESLYQDRDLVSARKYLTMAIKKNTGSRREQAALQRLVEIALKTNDLDNVDEYLGRLERIPPDRLEPSVPYVRGKYHYFRGKLDEATAILSGIPPSNPYYLQSRYFLGTVQVKKGDVASAASAFDAVLRVQPRNDDDKEIQDLARMAIGRVLHDRGQFDKAKEAYGSVPRQSKHFFDAMYELTWTAIKAKDFVGAYRSLDLMLLQNPDSPQAPELKILRGNLHLRLMNFYLASESFTQTRDEFDPIHKQVLGRLEQSKNDPKYFEALLGKGLEKFDIALFVPVVAVKWVRAEPDVARMLTLADDLGGLQRDVRDSEQALVRIERAVGGAGKVGIFPDLAAARTKSTEVLNQTIDIRRGFARRMRELIAGSLGPEDKAALDQVGSERAALEQELQALPLTADGLRKRELDAKGQLGKRAAEVSELNVQLQAMEAELVAIEQYFIRSRADQKIRPEDLEQPVKDLRAGLEEVRAVLERTRTEITETAREFGAAGAAADGERNATVRLGDLLKREHEIFQRARGRLGGGDQREFDKISGILTRADGVQTRLGDIDARVDAAAERRLGAIRERIAAEKGEIAAVTQKLGGVLSESQSVGGGLAQVMLAKVTDRFYDLVVQSDVGLVDVSWGLKDQKTTTLSKLINQQKLELKSVDEDFKSLLLETEEK